MQEIPLNLSIDTNFNFNSLVMPQVPPSPSFNEQYYNHLTKTNPTFALLYSDVSTLSGEEKNLLIEALAKDHKEKTLQLLAQHSKLKQIKSMHSESNASLQKELNSLAAQLEEVEENYSLSK